MAKNRNRDRARRDAVDIANGVPLLGLEPTPRSAVDLSQIEDRRISTPGVYRPAKTFRGWSRLRILQDPVKPLRIRKRLFSHQVQFADPRSTLICVRRSQRREVLFAKKRAGRGGMRRPRRNQFSSIVCRRR